VLDEKADELPGIQARKLARSLGFISLELRAAVTMLLEAKEIAFQSLIGGLSRRSPTLAFFAARRRREGGSEKVLFRNFRTISVSLLLPRGCLFSVSTKNL
jgi:hypothetical protein